MIEGGDWRLHDLRRTVATNMAVMKVPPHIIEAVLNHKTGIVSGVAAVYNRHAYYDEKREALSQWETRVANLLGLNCSDQAACPRSLEFLELRDTQTSVNSAPRNEISTHSVRYPS
jgi:hypothetical protein